MPFDLTILGSGSATPTPDRYASAQFLIFGDHYILIDCGEGAQIQMMRYGVKSFKLDMVFISHLHPDHFLGLPGLISSLSLKGRTEPLNIYAPAGLKEILEVQFLYGEVHLTYQLRFHQFNTEAGKIEFKDKSLIVYSFPVSHRVPCRAFLFKEKKSPRKINKELQVASKLPPEAYPVLRNGNDYAAPDGKVWLSEDYTIPNDIPFCYLYVTDTLFLPELAKSVLHHQIHTVYHEATFMEILAGKAIATCHSTTTEAAEFALLCGAKRLLLGHFSSRYQDLDPLLNEAKEIFLETWLATDGTRFEA